MYCGTKKPMDEFNHGHVIVKAAARSKRRVIDALHVTKGGVNPVLTVKALALRNAESLAAKI